MSQSDRNAENEKASRADVADVIIAGTGPSGLIAAILLARSGLDTVLVGPAAPRDDRRTTALLESSVRILDRIGLWPAIARHAAPLKRMRIVDDTKRLFRAPETVFDSAEIGLDAFGYNILNEDLNVILHDAAATTPSLRRVEGFVTGIVHHAHDCEVMVAGAGSLRARLLVGADGRNSRVREAAGIGVKRWNYDQAALVLNLRHDRPHHDTSTEFHTPSGPFTLVPLGDGRSSLVCVERPAEAERLTTLSPEALSLELERRAKSFLGKMRVDGPVQIYPLSGMTAEKVAAKRSALIGETAHVFPPIGAQGLNLSLRDIEALGHVLERARAEHLDIGGEEVMARYERARRTDIATRTTAVDLLNRTLLADFLPIQMMRSVGLYLAGRIPPLRKLMMREGVAPGFISARGDDSLLGRLSR
ncbi:UbiH/UbiF family hydroxylase [Breoghania sp. L-A4]|uniref:UbiH/UbiF family hydroxylase n=1 Tax=Breoghania sp. L-A4 TaxID=2304600 RepID=UPI000E35A41F|nr:UbiH/UbiF family hydroxylase [Breoghania sp. L-A4]AXS40586.1 UbiH/UbiF family hydroxylase [Breoghania sp. L-A4]